MHKERYQQVIETDVLPMKARAEKAERALAEMAELAKRAKSQAAAPDYDEEAIRDLLWAIVDAALPFLRNQSGGVPDAGANQMSPHA